MEPLISIIIPLYNQGEFLEDSIGSALAQTYKNIEIIVIEDGSTDGKTPKIADSFASDKVKIIHQSNTGLATARNNGISNSQGEFFIPLDADDKIEPTFIEKTLKLMVDDKVGVVYTDQKFFGEENRVMPMKDFDFTHLLVQNHVSVCSLIRRSAYDEVKKINQYGYNPNMKFGYEDWDLWISLGELGWKFNIVHEPLFHYRKRGTSMINNTVKNHEFLISTMYDNHKDTFNKYQKEVVVILQNLLMDREFLLRDMKKQEGDPSWLSKKLFKSILGK